MIRFFIRILLVCRSVPVIDTFKAFVEKKRDFSRRSGFETDRGKRFSAFEGQFDLAGNVGKRDDAGNGSMFERGARHAVDD